MTEQEAIKQIKSEKWVDKAVLDVVNDIAISAIEKQIPVKPEKLDELAHRVFYQCSKCKQHIYHNDNFCRHCGQAISWRGV